uniref:Uncharacterized protein n=1 Tax=Setaria italica TaxID=4555 RepID=K3ZF15_SETIT
MEDWMLPSPSPRTLMSSFSNEEFSSCPFSSIFSDNGISKLLDAIEKSKTLVDSSVEETVQDTKAPLQLESNLFSANLDGVPEIEGGFARKVDPITMTW